MAFALEAVQQQVDIVFADAVFAGIASRAHSGFAAKRIHFETRVVGKAVVAVMLFYVVGFNNGIAFDGLRCFGYIFVTVDVGEA